MHLLARAPQDMAARLTAWSPASVATGPCLPITLGPEQAVAHRAWREARARALAAALVRGPGLVLVVGPAGTGKSLLLRELARALAAGGADAILHGRGDLPLALPAAGGSPDRHRVVLIDEANRMDEAALQRLARSEPGTLVLAGLADPGDPAPDDLPPHPTLVRLAALEPSEVGAFVTARLAQAGLPGTLVSNDAVERLAVHSGGVPRLLNTLLSAALFLAGAPGTRVMAEHVDEATACREGVAGIAAPKASVTPSAAIVVDAAPAGSAPLAGSPAVVLPAPASPALAPTVRIAPTHPRRRRYGLAACAALIVAVCGALVLTPRNRAAPVTVAAAQSTDGRTAVPALPALALPRTEAATRPEIAAAAEQQVPSSNVAPAATPVVAPSPSEAPVEASARRPILETTETHRASARVRRVAGVEGPGFRRAEPSQYGRCRDVLIRSQLLEEPSDADRLFLLSGSCSSRVKAP